LFASHSFNTSAVHSFPVSHVGISGNTLWLLARSVRAAYRSRVPKMHVQMLAAAKCSGVDPDEPITGAKAGNLSRK
jgi:hypothetical protein